jgi:hypothetical protein
MKPMATFNSDVKRKRLEVLRKIAIGTLVFVVVLFISSIESIVDLIFKSFGL